MCTGHAVRTGPGLITSASLSSLWTLSQGGGGKKKIQSLNLSFLSPALIMTPLHTFFFFTVFFFSVWFFGFLFLYLPHPSSSFVLKYNQECGKLEGDPVLCLSQGGTGRDMLGFCQPFPRVLGADLVGCWVFQLPQSSLASASGVPAVQQPDCIF